MKTLIVKKEGNVSILNYLLETFPSLSKASLYKALRNKDIKVNGKRINSNIYINASDKIDVYIPDNILYNLPKSISYIYQDENIAIVFKPQGLLSNNEGNLIDEPTLDDLVKKDNPNFIICHRLDRNTSGLLIFAKTRRAYNQIMLGFKNNSIEKEYIAYVANSNFKYSKRILNQYITTDKKKGISKIYNENDVVNNKDLRAITTSYEVLYTDTKNDFSILKVKIHNGKTHQIRAVLASLGHPIIGDQKYGKNEINRKFKKYKQLLFAIKYNFNFYSSSYLNYLNNKNILLDESYYINYIGDIYEKNTKS